MYFYLQHTGAPDSSTAAATTTQMLRTALISVTCVLVMMSALVFLIGLILSVVTASVKDGVSHLGRKMMNHHRTLQLNQGRI